MVAAGTLASSQRAARNVAALQYAGRAQCATDVAKTRGTGMLNWYVHGMRRNMYILNRTVSQFIPRPVTLIRESSINGCSNIISGTRSIGCPCEQLAYVKDLHVLFFFVCLSCVQLLIPDYMHGVWSDITLLFGSTAIGYLERVHTKTPCSLPFLEPLHR